MFTINNKKKLIVICILVLMLLNSCTNFGKQSYKQVSYNITKGFIYRNIVQSGGSFGCEDNKLFLNDLSLDTIETTTVFLQALYGEASNYGLCYGPACYINEKLYNSPIEPSLSLQKLKNYYSSSENMLVMDLTIPVFQTIYFSEEQNQYAYATSYYFVKDLIERKGLEYTVNLLK